MFFSLYQKPIFVSLSPNLEKHDLALAFKLIFKKQDKQSSAKLEQAIKDYLGVKYAVSFNSGRTAFLAILKGLSLSGQALTQAFTCSAAVNPIIKAVLKPVFVDLDPRTLNMDSKDLERKITPDSKLVLLQHTFGQSADLRTISKICQDHNLILIEDCAHCLGATFNQRKLGTFGKAAFFSFGRDKVLSSVFGGMAVTDDEDLAKKLRDFQQSLGYPSQLWVFQQLLHPILTSIVVMPLYGFWGIGKWLLILLQKVGLLSKAVSWKEKQAELPDSFGKRMPEKLASLALAQFQNLNRILEHQKIIANFYQNNLKNPDLILPFPGSERIYMRYPVLFKNQNTDKILSRARRKSLFLDDGWRKTVIAPPDTNQGKYGYEAGSCPQAEMAAKSIINLPTHINIAEKQAKRIVDFLNQDANILN